jgi:hypothetical protein
MERVRLLLKQLRDMLEAGGNKHHCVEHIDAALTSDDDTL